MDGNMKQQRLSEVLLLILMVVVPLLGQGISESDPHTGDWTPGIDACIPGSNNLIIDGLSFDTCKALCQSVREFVCRSVEYNPRIRKCQLSTSSRRSPNYRQPCNAHGWIFTEINRPPTTLCLAPFCRCGFDHVVDWFVTQNGCNDCRCIPIPNPCPAPSCICNSNQDYDEFVKENGCQVCRCIPKPRWTRVTNSCIRGKRNLVLRDISLEDCRDQCQDNTDFECKSVEYHSSNRRCSLSTETSSSSRYINPCNRQGWTFTEIIGECRDKWPQSATFCNNGINSGRCYRSCNEAQANGGCRNWIASDVCPKTCGTCQNIDTCRQGFEEVVNQCLFIDDNVRRRRLEASDQCKRMGGYLATVRYPNELSAFILENYPQKNFWVGGSDEETTGLWLWESGDAVSSSFPWGINQAGVQQPAGRNQHCMAIKFFRRPRRSVYVDNRCQARRYYICEAR